MRLTRKREAAPGDVGGIFESTRHGHGVQTTIWADPPAAGWHGEAFAISASIYTYMRLGARSLTKPC